MIYEQRSPPRAPKADSVLYGAFSAKDVNIMLHFYKAAFRKYLSFCAAAILTGAVVQTDMPVYQLNSFLLTKSAISGDDAAAADADGNGILNAADLSLLKHQIFTKNLEKYAALSINEICASNHASYLASDGSSPDWLELYNAGDTALDLSGCGLSDQEKDLFRFVFPSGTIIPADSYLLIFCDDSGNSAGLHTPFKLSASGETVYLSSPQKTLIDSAAFPELDTDITYAKMPDGSGAWMLCSATAGKSNQTAEQQINADLPVFSKAAGFYDDAFDLTLSAASGCQILYTIDGSDPRSSDSASVYQNPLPVCDNSEEPNILSAKTKISSVSDYVPDEAVDKGIVIRAVCQDAEGHFGKVVTNSYFIGKTAPYYHTVRTISISAAPDDLFSDQTGIYLQKNCLNRGTDWERPVNIQVFENGSAVYSEDVGVRIAGNWSRNYPQKSLTFYARSSYGASKMEYDFFSGTAKDCGGKTIKAFDKVTLRNGGDGYDAVRFRDDLNAELSAGLAIGTQAKQDYIVFIDGEFWGHYSMQEKLDDEYLEAHYHIPKENITTIKNTLGEGDEAVWQEYFDFYDWAKNADFTDDANYRKFCQTIDVQSMIDWIIAESTAANWDALINVNNTMIWRANQTDSRQPYADGKWRFLLFDTEYSSGFNGISADCHYLENMDTKDAPNCFGTLFYRLIQNPSFAEQFRTSCQNAMQTHYSPERAAAGIDSYTERCTELYLDTYKRFGVEINAEKLDEMIAELRDFWAQRSTYAMADCENCIAAYADK